MNFRRTLLAALALVAVASFVQPVAALDVATAGISGLFGDVLGFFADHGDEIATIARALIEIFGMITVGVAGLFGDVLNFFADHGDELATIAEALIEIFG
jgi:hypothetical protein